MYKKVYRFIVLVTLVALLFSAGMSALGQQGDPPQPPGPGGSGPAPIFGLDDPNAIPDQFIVVFNKGVAPGLVKAAAQQAERSQGAAIHFMYTTVLNGFAATLPAEALNGIVNNPNVAYVEADMTVTLDATQSPATWGLDRIDQRNLPLSNSYTYNFTGSGVYAYIIDTGILASHNEFGGRVSSGYTAINDGRGTSDCNGHGTHVAGTVGGATYGVAKGVALVAVRVLNCSGSGTNSGVIAGVDWVTNNHASPAVANMSLGGSRSTAVDSAVANSINSGVTYAVAAGNSNANACNYSPAAVASALTVGSTTSSDARSSFSNFGSCLDIFAPGSSITSAWYTSNTATNTISGTSMASPHVAGAAALYLQANPGSSPSQVASGLVNNATTGVVTSAGSGSPNRLLYTIFGSGPGPTPVPSPTPTQPPGGGAPCTNCTLYTGSLSGSGDYDYQPNGTYYYSSVSGTHSGWLRGPSGTDFDLYLQRWNGWYWQTVAQGISSSSSEDVSYYGNAGYYVWRIESYSGSGSYNFWMRKP